MKIVAKSKGVATELEIPGEVRAIVMQPGMKVTAPDAYLVSIETTTKCMADMSQKAWEHISTGPLFQHFFNMLFGEDAWIPPTIQELNDEDRSVIHGAGLIIQLVEARFAGRKEVFLQTPEDSFHPKQEQMLMSVIQEIRKIPMDGDMNVQTEPCAGS
jgi:hypothetical protein